MMSEEGLEDLAASIKLLGILEPLLVTPCNFARATGRIPPNPEDYDGQLEDVAGYEIIDGHRRYVAAGMVGLAELACLVFEHAEQAKYAMMLHANVCREDVTPAEEGWQFLTLAEKHHWSLAELVRFFRKSESYINERTDLVQKDPAVAQAVAERKITLAQAKVINLAKQPERIAYLLDQAVTNGATARNLRVFLESYRAQDQVSLGLPAPHTPPEQVPPPANAEKVCIWCSEATHQEHMKEVQVHWFHKRDLERLLEQVGLRRPTPPPEAPAGESAEPAAS